MHLVHVFMKLYSVFLENTAVCLVHIFFDIVLDFLYSILSPIVVDCHLISSVQFVLFPSFSLCRDTRGL